MKLSENQILVLMKLSQPHPIGQHHPKDAYNLRTLDALEKKKLVVFYHHPIFLHGAVKITEDGINVLTKNVSKGEL